MPLDRSLRVLVVDDYRTMVKIVGTLLRQIGFSDIDEAFDGITALRMMREKTYGLVICDWNMDPMTGYEMLKQVRADLTLRATPFIMMTAESRIENMKVAKEAGVSEYLVKPFNAVTLLRKIEASLE